MPWKDAPPDFWGILTAFIISLISGFISIAQRIARGHEASILWVISEFLAAVLSGYLMYESWETLKPIMPSWMTLPVAIAVSAHFGGRALQMVESQLYEKYGLLKGNDRRKPK